MIYIYIKNVVNNLGDYLKMAPVLLKTFLLYANEHRWATVDGL